jgi:FtsZ-binding cell division protein ZapB
VERVGGLVTRETTVNGKTRSTFDYDAFATQFPELTSLGYFDPSQNTRVQGINHPGLIPYLVEALNEQKRKVDQHQQTLATQQQTLVKQRRRLNQQQNALQKQNQLFAALLGKRR